MDGVHDLGGRQGFGPVAVDEREEPFHSDWEARMWGIARALRRPPGWTIDWWRHGRELIDPADYLTRPYYDQWMQTYAALLVDSGVATVAEIAAGSAQAPVLDLGAPQAPEAVRAATAVVVRFDREIADAPAFAVGDRVRANAMGAEGHTRLPGYVRGRLGVVEAHRGAHLLPDAGARGEERAEPLYSVAFEAAVLWPEAGGRRDRVYLDLWESYLERP